MLTWCLPNPPHTKKKKKKKEKRRRKGRNGASKKNPSLDLRNLSTTHQESAPLAVASYGATAEDKEEAEHGHQGDRLEGGHEGPEDAVDHRDRREVDIRPTWSEERKVELRPMEDGP